MTVAGATLRFHVEAEIAISGAHMPATLDGASMPHDALVRVAAAQVLAIGPIAGPGQRAYLAVRGGFGAPVVLGSRATFALGGFGGHTTGTLKTGDVLHLADRPAQSGVAADPAPLTQEWTLAVVYGPHGAPDFFQQQDITDLFAARYEVHFNSARTGVRLMGPTPRWARPDGGEAGLHPSNLHDNAYAVGSIDFTGDMPILLGPDGPSLGGFVCPAVVAREDLWKLGQLKPGDSVRFVPASRPTTTRSRSPAFVGCGMISAARSWRSSRATSPPSIAVRATTTSWSNMGRWRSTSRCACVCICWPPPSPRPSSTG